MYVHEIHSSAPMVNVSRRDGVAILMMIAMTTPTKKAVNDRHATKVNLHATMDGALTQLSNVMQIMTAEISQTRLDARR